MQFLGMLGKGIAGAGSAIGGAAMNAKNFMTQPAIDAAGNQAEGLAGFLSSPLGKQILRHGQGGLVGGMGGSLGGGRTQADDEFLMELLDAIGESPRKKKKRPGERLRGRMV